MYMQKSVYHKFLMQVYVIYVHVELLCFKYSGSYITSLNVIICCPFRQYLYLYMYMQKSVYHKFPMHDSEFHVEASVVCVGSVVMWRMCTACLWFGNIVFELKVQLLSVFIAIYSSMHIHVHVQCKYMYKNVHVYIHCTCACTCVYTLCTYMYMYMCAYIYISTCTWTYQYASLHTRYLYMYSYDMPAPTHT